MEARVTPDLLDHSSGMTASLWPPMDMRGVGKKRKRLLSLRMLTKTPSSRNVYSEKSKADDVQFILDLITKIAEEIPAADMNNVNIAGRSNRKIFCKCDSKSV